MVACAFVGSIPFVSAPRRARAPPPPAWRQLRADVQDDAPRVSRAAFLRTASWALAATALRAAAGERPVQAAPLILNPFAKKKQAPEARQEKSSAAPKEKSSKSKSEKRSPLSEQEARDIDKLMQKIESKENTAKAPE
ncbi:hypothetical protein CDCA_CDCA14G3805 [Cyanidium caldarium]|uniref:Uncharacterized protein n=1 Tax=Cyanidium caldarium TaxID=2771 RepID=A0AAV9J0D4_CYACA|nr:hypothetical protein CDCA_CDCA14G3805 [Cyanidium caldarium]|eukprot:ctg_714.g300